MVGSSGQHWDDNISAAVVVALVVLMVVDFEH